MFGWRKSTNSRVESPVDSRFSASLFALREHTDSRVFWLLVTQWVVTLLTSFVVSSRWNESRLDALSAAVIWVGVLSVVPLALVLRSPGTLQSRWSVVVSQGLMSTLLWYVSGGRPDSHLHLFAWLVVLSLYRDASVLVAGGVTALVGHTVLYFSGAMPALSHDDPSLWFTQVVWMSWLAGETAFLTVFVMLDRQALAAQLERDYALESLQSGFHGKVEDVTRKLIQERDMLRVQLVTANERRNWLESARSEMSQELLTLRTSFATCATEILNLTSRPSNEGMSRDWRSHWEALRRRAQQLMRLIDLRSIEQSESDSQESAEDVRRAQKLETQKKAILLMRNPLQQARAVAALETEGYSVDVVPNGPRAYYSAMLNDYSLVVVDIDLPGDEGFDTLEALHLLPPDRHGRQRCLFAVTSELTPDRVLRCTNLEVDGMFLKPLKAESMHQTLVSRTSSQKASNQETHESLTGSASSVF